MISRACSNPDNGICVFALTLYMLLSSSDSLCKQFEHRSGSTKWRARSGSKLFDVLMVFLKFIIFGEC